ncbi:acyltransferase [Methylobacterium sp. BTF04]|uniref:acyltransferase family protein n=1 Tax=Methylobacterium sp. BTF04 TaxID=2708300 RepID=UPI0019535A71|nr:acyltransferase [Methylobacterium sp. BTF04]
MKLVAIQILRAFAALLVVMHHAQFEAATLATRVGTPFLGSTMLPWRAGVDVFFVISGFIIVHAARSLYGQPGGRARFLAHRVARLVPLYWLVTTLYLVVAWRTPALLNGGDNLVPGYVAAAFLFWPALRADGLIQPLYSLGWTLNYEMAFYLVFAVGLGWGRRAAFAWLCVALSGLVALGLLVAGLPTPLAFWSDPIVLEFALGAAIGLVRAEGLRLAFLPRLGLAAAGLVLLASAGTVTDLARPLAYGIPALLLVAAAALGSPGRMDETSRPVRALIALGDASYALYLLHPFVLRGAREAILRLGLAPVLGPWGGITLMVALAIVISLAAARFVEQPLTRTLRRWLDPAPRLQKTV